MYLFILAIALVFIATGACAMVEAALYAVPQPYIRRLVESGNPAGLRLQAFKEKMDYPITAILIFDTVLGVGGAAIAGSQARALYGETFVYWFTLVLAIGLLVFAQIVPKIIGVVYNQAIARSTAIPIATAISIMYPVVRGLEFFTRHLKPEDPPKRAIEDDVKQLARISVEEGSILGIEADLIQNSLQLNDLKAAEIMTPLKQVISLPASLTVADAFKDMRHGSYSRFPISDPNTADHWTGLVLSRDILFAVANDRDDVKLQEIAKPLHFVAADLPGHRLLDAFLKHRSHLFAVQGSTAEPIGVVTLEDVLEEILGKEIEDEKTRVR